MNDDDRLLRQHMFQVINQQMGGPQFQPIQSAMGGVQAGQGPDPRMYGAPIQQIGNAMGRGPATPGPGAGQGNQAARQGGYAASKPGAMGQLNRRNPSKTQQPWWMARK